MSPGDWEAAAGLLGRLDGSFADVRHIIDLQSLLDALGRQPPAPKALWKKLVQQKVPLKLLKACAQTLQRLDQPVVATAMAARAATSFLAAAGRAGVVQSHTEGHQMPSGSSSSSGGGVQGTAGGASSSTASASTSSALCASFLLQLQQSGLPAQLPAVLSAATQQLQRLVATAAAGRVDAGSEEETSLQKLVIHLLALAVKMLVMPPEHNKGVTFAPLPAVAGLILSCLRYLTCIAAAETAGQQQQQQAAWQPHNPILQEWLNLVDRAIQLLVFNMYFGLRSFRDSNYSSTRSSCSSSSSSSAAQATAAAAAAEQVLCSEECFLCLAVWFIAVALPLAATPAQQQLVGGISSSNGSGGSSGSSRGSSSSSGGKASRQAGQQPQDQGAGCLTSQLPTQPMAVLQQAGVSAEVVLVMGQEVKKDRALAVAEFNRGYRACDVFSEAQDYVPGLLLDRELLRRFALLHKLTCAASLQLAGMFAMSLAGQPCTPPSCAPTVCLFGSDSLLHMTSRFAVVQLRFCNRCCIAAWSSARQAKRLLHLQPLCQQGWSLEQAKLLMQLQAQISGGSGSSSSGSSNNSNPNNSSNSDQHTQQQQSFDYSSCVRSVHGLLQHLLQLWGSATAVLTAADAPNGLRLLGSSSSSADQAAVPEVLQGEAGSVVLRCISSTVNMLSAALLPLLSDCHAAEGSAAGTSAGGQDVLAVGRLCALLSIQTRASIEAVQVSSSSGTVALRQSGQLLSATLQAAVADLLHAVQVVSIHSNTWEQLIKAAGVGCDSYDSPEQRYLFDLLCSLLKLCSIDSNLLQQQPGFSLAGILGIVCSVAITASERVACAANSSRNGTAATQAAGSAAATASDDAAAAPPAQQDTAAAAAGSSASCLSTTAMLPWLVLLGRCCLLWARWLQLLSMQLTEGGSLDQWVSRVVKGTWDVTVSAAALPDPWSQLPGQQHTIPLPASLLHIQPSRLGGTKDLSLVILHAAGSATAWLEAGSNMQQLVALGYNLQPLQEALVQLRADADACTSVIGMCPQLQVVGQALTAFAMPLACNNPGCVNASGPSEARLVGGKSCVCAGCLTARYCSRACLKQHWKVHKPVCKALEATAAAHSQAAGAANTQHASG